MNESKFGLGSRRGSWLVGGTALIAATLFLLGSAAAAHPGAPPPTTTYSVSFVSHGLAASSSWSVYFNGVTYSGTKATITITGVSGGSYYFSAAQAVAGSTGIQYYAGSNTGYISVPAQLSHYIVYTKEYAVTIGVNPTGSGYTNPGTTYFVAGETFPLSAIAYTGYTFSTWVSSSKSLILGSKTAASTNVTIGAPGTLTAKFKAEKYPITYTEVGLPAGTIWSVTSGGTAYVSSTSTIKAATSVVGNLYWSVAPVSSGTTAQYAPWPASGGMYVPSQTMQTISFVKQYQVSVVATPSSTGSTSPSGTAFYTAGTNLSVVAYSTSSYQFSSWTAGSTNLGIGGKTNSSTNVTIKGPGTLTAHFSPGSSCTTCTVTIYESGLPANANWGVGYNNSWYPSTVTRTTNSLKFTGLGSGYFYWSTASAVASPSSTSGVIYIPSSTGGYIYVPSQLAYTIVYTPEYYVGIITNPQYGAGGVGPASGYYPAGSELPIWSGGGNGWVFSKWTASTTKLPFAKSSSPATTAVVNGPGTIVANFVLPTTTVSFTESGLAKGTLWSLTFDGAVYASNTSTITIHSVSYGGHSWYPDTPFDATTTTQWVALAWNYGGLSGTLQVPFQNVENIVFEEEFKVNYYTAGTSGGSISPSGLNWYLAGSIVALDAINGTSANFTSWKSSSSTNLAIGSTTMAATYLVIQGAGSVTCTFH
ncbi:MAG TPA: hypothetical protein VGV89_06735 [Thermoplasmata archaeon]|nr:hypothetical protein [Thermoplasmata archaeon]